MTEFKHNIITWLSLPAIGLLIVFSIMGSFYGAEKAKLFFNSIPLVIYWFGLAASLIAGIVTFPRLVRSPPLFIMTHFGCLLILAGSMWGSQLGHRLNNQLFAVEKIPNGYMTIFKGETEKYIMSEDFNRRLGQLPFSIKLRDFRIEYYPAQKNQIYNYCSVVTIIENGKEILNKTIKVNEPLHYGGYHFYQNSYDSQRQRYTILQVTSDNGLYVVYAGYWMLCIGVLWHFWFNKILKRWL
jgi:cytochrome c biogenesis protein ResB